MTDIPPSDEPYQGPTWMPSHCQCEMATDEAGEPTAFVRRCGQHQEATPADVAAENRALTLARMAISARTGRDVRDVAADFDWAARVARCEGPGFVAEVAPVTLSEYLGQHPNVAALARAA